MAEAKKTTNELDQQTSAAAESIRDLVKRHEVRGGMTQASVERFLDELEQIAAQLDEQGKSEKEVAKLREEQGKPTPEQEQKPVAEQVKETLEESEKEDERRKKAGEPIPGQPQPETAVWGTRKPETDPNANRAGIPATPAQPTTGKRDAVETAAKKADDSVKKAAEKK